MSILGVFFVGLVSSFAGSLAGSYIMHRVLTRPKKVPVLPKLPEAGTPYRESGKHVHSLECTIENCGEPWEEDEPLLEEQEEQETKPEGQHLVKRAEAVPVKEKPKRRPKVGMANKCPICEEYSVETTSRCEVCEKYDVELHVHQTCRRCGSKWLRLPQEVSKSEFLTS